LQAIDAWCAWRTLQTSPYMNAVILRINQSFPGLFAGLFPNAVLYGYVRGAAYCNGRLSLLDNKDYQP